MDAAEHGLTTAKSLSSRFALTGGRIVLPREIVEGKAQATSTPLGNVPAELDMEGLESFPQAKFASATAVEKGEWRDEMKLHAELLEKRLGGQAPAELAKRFEELSAAFE